AVGSPVRCVDGPQLGPSQSRMWTLRDGGRFIRKAGLAVSRGACHRDGRRDRGSEGRGRGLGEHVGHRQAGHQANARMKGKGSHANSRAALKTVNAERARKKTSQRPHLAVFRTPEHLAAMRERKRIKRMIEREFPIVSTRDVKEVRAPSPL